MVRIACSFALVFLVAGCATGNVVKRSEPTTIYYIAFETETYTPVTIGNIECRAESSFDVEQSDLSIFSFLSDAGGASTFDGQRIRMKVTTTSGAVYIDSNGVGTDGDLYYQFDKRRLAEHMRTLPAQLPIRASLASCAP
jgi:hypothetical protein